MSNSEIVGYYYDVLNLPHGFLYDGANFTTLDDPLGFTFASGVDGSTIVGYFQDLNGNNHGFIDTPDNSPVPRGLKPDNARAACRRDAFLSTPSSGPSELKAADQMAQIPWGAGLERATSP